MAKDSKRKTTRRPRANGANRRQVLGNLAAAGIAASWSGPALAARRDIDKRLGEPIRNVVVIFAENRSFNNLFSNFPGLQHPLSKVPRERFQQRDRDGTLLTGLPPIWGGLVPTEQVLDSRRYQIGQEAITGLANGHFPLRTPDGDPLPHGLVTRDLAHLFYH